MKLVVDNKHSFFFDRKEGLDIIDTGKKYKEGGKVVVFEVPVYAGRNENKQIARCNIELDAIATIFEKRKIYYCSPYSFEFKFQKHAAPSLMDRFTFVEFTDADMKMEMEKSAIVVVDPDASYQMILNLIRSYGSRCEKMIFFVHADKEQLLKMLTHFKK